MAYTKTKHIDMLIQGWIIKWVFFVQSLEFQNLTFLTFLDLILRLNGKITVTIEL